MDDTVLEEDFAMNRRHSWALTFLLIFGGPTWGQGNLLRNGSFQDDWLTLIPENKNHHWCYSSEFYNRRDFNPDGWTCKGNWHWQNADAPYGQRVLQVKGPATLTQRVNWVLVHDHKNIGNMADAGGFPQMSPTRSRFPERLVRDLTFRVGLNGTNVPEKAGVIELGLCPPGGLTIADPLGSMVPATITVSTPIPSGTFATRWLEVKLPAAEWLKAAKAQGATDPKESAALAQLGPVLPGTVQVAIKYQAATGSVAVEHAELVETRLGSPNFLPNGRFDELSEKTPNYPAGWELPVKYRHFPGRLYYLFNTWHNSSSDNRGKVAIDRLVFLSGKHSLQMIVPSGDEVAVASESIPIRQKEPRLLEVHALVKTHRLAMLHIDAVDEKGERLDSYPFIHMAPLSVGTEEWREVRQVFRPRQPVRELRIMLCARGVNGYTLDDTSHQPQNNVVGTVWWDNLMLFEPESTKEELASRGIKAAKISGGKKKVGHSPVYLRKLDPGECFLGDNILSATLGNPGKADSFSLVWTITSPTGKQTDWKSNSQQIPQYGVALFQVPYTLTELCATAYTEYRGKITVVNGQNKAVASSELWFGTWTVPIKIRLGALYLRPEQKQLVRLNVGLVQATMKKLASVRLEVIQRSSGKVLKSITIPGDPEAIQAQRGKIPRDLRDDLTNLLLADLDVSFLPVQPFAGPQRNWLIRASAIDQGGKILAAVESAPFCRQAHEPAQPPVKTVAIKNNLLFVNGQPWMPWGACYGHVPVYDGPADPGPGKYLDLANLPVWSMYDRFTAEPYSRHKNNFNCLRYIAGSITNPKLLDKHWLKDNLVASSAFIVPGPAFSIEELIKSGGGKEKLYSNLAQYKTGPVVSIAPGIEEAFGLFHGATPKQLKGLEEVVTFLRQQTSKPVMVGHGGYWNRLEFEKTPFFDIFDPETEPLYPANLHTDLMPLIKGKDKVAWLRPQMYEDVPYERWRFHVYVELMRGCRGWQIAHGPGDQSLFRGLRGELEFWKPIVYSSDPVPKIDIQPSMEHRAWRFQGKTYLIAATTRGLTLGKWRWQEEGETPWSANGRSRLTTDPHLLLLETNSYGADQKVDQGPSIHGIQYLPQARSWPKGSKLVQWVKIDEKNQPTNLIALAKTEGRWIHGAAWGKFDPASWSKDPERAVWFLRSFYRHSYGFLGWDLKLLDRARPYMLSKTTPMGPVPAPGKWLRLEIPLEKIDAADGLLDGIAFAHEGGKVFWGPTSLIDPAGKESIIRGDFLEHPPADLARSKITVAGLKKGGTIRVLFEDRRLSAEDGYFLDNFCGQDLYQRYGGSYGSGYGNGPVALHLYEID
jgi:hypothetical protein